MTYLPGCLSVIAMCSASSFIPVSRLVETTYPNTFLKKSIQNGCQVYKASPDTDICDVGQQYLVQMADSHPFGKIGMPGEAAAAIGSLHLLCLARHSRSLSRINRSTFL